MFDQAGGKIWRRLAPALLKFGLHRSEFGIEGQRCRRGWILFCQQTGTLDPLAPAIVGHFFCAGRPVTSAKALRPGQPLQAQWTDGQAELQVTVVQLGLPGD